MGVCVWAGGGALSELPSAFVRSLCSTLRSLRPSRMAETAQKCGKWFVAFSAIYRPFDGQSRNAPNTDHGGGPVGQPQPIQTNNPTKQHINVFVCCRDGCGRKCVAEVYRNVCALV